MRKTWSVTFLAAAAVGALAWQDTRAIETPLTEPFATGWMLTDTNQDGIADFIAGKIVVPANPSAAENAAAADLAARAGYGTTGLTPPVVVTADPGSGPRIW